MPKIVVLDGYTLNPGDLSWDPISKQGDLAVYDRTPVGQITERIGDAPIIFTNKTPITAETLAACPQVRFIGVLATGYNVVDTAAAKARGVVVCNVPTYGTAAVAQMVFALLLEVNRHVGHHARRVREGAWSSCSDFCFWDYPSFELTGKTMGIVGFGKIGQATAHIAKAFDMRVLAYDPQITADGQLAESVSLDQLLGQSDVISLHCPLFPETQGIINQSSLAKMKRGAILINTSRGPLVVEPDVRDALESGQLGWYAADVVAVEPLAPDNPLLTSKNCLITPHIAWSPLEARARLMDVAADNLAAFLRGEPINVVNQ